MPSENSFDIVSKVNMQEIDNAANQAIKEIANRFDFRGSKTQITLNKETKEITIISDDEFKMKGVVEIIESKLVKRGVSIKSLDYGKIEPATGMTVRQVAKIKEGIEQEKAKQAVKLIKESGLKVTPSIQGDQVRVSGRNKDDLQSVMKLLRETNLGIPLQFTNFK